MTYGANEKMHAWLVGTRERLIRRALDGASEMDTHALSATVTALALHDAANAPNLSLAQRERAHAAYSWVMQHGNYAIAMSLATTLPGREHLAKRSVALQLAEKQIACRVCDGDRDRVARCGYCGGTGWD